ncbi:MAG TPA: S-methyl-5-thioribose-1-phosphate isomerase [Longimicrobiales bacterium]|nr:S-methyl-5-thioribose-1-phosphate isomerase [Longimicrobiales bacterium]
MHIRPPSPIRWGDDGRSVVVLDQTRLPTAEVELELRTLDDVFEAIRTLRVRGAPLIGIVAAMGVAALAKRTSAGHDPPLSPGALREQVQAWCARLAEARPTAVNLGWALERMRGVARAVAPSGSTRGGSEPARALRDEAQAIWDEDARMCRRIGEHALGLLGDGARVHTHCNAGALATGGIGTALAPVYLAHERGLRVSGFADETRPLLQGSRLTAWELSRAGIEVTVLADSAAAARFAADPPDLVLVGADRIAANGDVANKVGTYSLAVLAHRHGVPFYVLAPTSTVDLAADSGADIPIEHREGDELRRGFGSLTAPPEVPVWSPAFDVTPADLVTGIVTEQGLHRAPYGPALAEAARSAESEREPIEAAGPAGERRQAPTASADAERGSRGRAVEGRREAAEARAPTRDAETLARELAETGRKLHAAGLIGGLAGNLSARLEDGRALVTARGTHKGEIGPGGTLALALDATAAEAGAGSTEFPLHRASYRANPAVGAVIHTHAPALVAVAARGLNVSAALPEVELATGRIVVLPPLASGSEALATAVGEAVAAGAGVVILAGHGTVAVGADLDEARHRTELAELAAYTVLLMEEGGGAVDPAKLGRLRASLDGAPRRPG